MSRVVPASASYRERLPPSIPNVPPEEWAKIAPPQEQAEDDEYLLSALESILGQSFAEANAFAHPDSLRRFRTIESREDLEQALAAPWETWSVFLHPSQRRI